LKLDPHLPAIHLRPLLASCLPVDTNLSSDFIKKIRRRCQLYLASNDNPQDMNISIGNNLLSTSPVTESKINILESPKILSKCGNSKPMVSVGSSAFEIDHRCQKIIIGINDWLVIDAQRLSPLHHFDV
jgi:hypothetical protein